MKALDLGTIMKNTPKRNGDDKPVGRFAPSPTGYIHLGNVWAALLAWLPIRQKSGTMILRIEDLDPDRSRPEYVERLVRDMKWLGLDWDEDPWTGGAFGPYSQSDRREIYEAALDALKDRGKVYPCFCTRKELREASAPHEEDGVFIYNGKCRRLSGDVRRERLEAGDRHAWRLEVPDQDYGFHDLNYGAYMQNVARDCGDFLLTRTDGVHAYQLAVVVDDGLMGVDMVVRGSDLMDSTPRQIYLHELLGFDIPSFGHVPLLKGENAARLSKRHKSLDLGTLRNAGWAAEEILGLLAVKAGLIERFEPVKARELIDVFSWSKLPKTDISILDSELIKP